MIAYMMNTQKSIISFPPKTNKTSIKKQKKHTYLVGITPNHHPQRRILEHRQLIYSLPPFLGIPSLRPIALSHDFSCIEVVIGRVTLVSENHRAAGPVSSVMLTKTGSQSPTTGLYNGGKAGKRRVLFYLKPPGSMSENLIPHSGFTSWDMASVAPSTAHFDAQ